MIKRKITAIIFTLLLMISNIYIYADNNDRLKNVQNQIKDIRGQIGQKNEKLSDINQNILKIDNRISEIETKIFENQNNLKKIQNDIKANKEKIKQKQKEISDLNILLKKRIKTMSKINNLDYIEIILSSKDIKDFLSKYTTVKRIIKQDNENIEKLKLAKNELDKTEKSLEKNEQDRRNIINNLNIQNQTLVENKKQQDEIVKKLNSDINSLSQLENLRIQESNQIQEEIRKAEEQRRLQEQRRLEELRKNNSSKSSANINFAPVTYSGGKMAFPIPGGIITSPYGSRFHPILKRQLFHTGIDIGAGYGTAIHAAKSGVVISAGYKGTYGQAVIIDHGGSISTLYAHCSAVNVSAGQRVNAGDVVAYVGNSGRSTGPHLHFEVRVNGQHTNPIPYLR